MNDHTSATPEDRLARPCRTRTDAPTREELAEHLSDLSACRTQRVVASGIRMAAGQGGREDGGRSDVLARGPFCRYVSYIGSVPEETYALVAADFRAAGMSRDARAAVIGAQYGQLRVRRHIADRRPYSRWELTGRGTHRRQRPTNSSSPTCLPGPARYCVLSRRLGRSDERD